MARSRFRAFAPFLLPIAAACTGTSGNGRDTASGTTLTTSASGTSDSSGTDGTAGGTSGSGTDSAGTDSTAGGTSGGSSSTTGLKFDIGNIPDTPGASDTGNDQGCKKIDFLFVVDNSGSMGDEQQSLATSFPGFIDSIQNTVMAQDYHIMVVDTDADAAAAQCDIICTILPDCNGIPCNMLPPPPGGCDATLGAGVMKSQGGVDCGITGGNRYMIDGQPDLSPTFECAALVGTGGDGNEKTMEAMVKAVGPENLPNACNEGFVRDDAILVVTFITDEEDLGKSAGTPATWKTALVTAKNNNEDAVVVLGLIGDTDQPNPTCTADLAEASPTLRTFAESFNFGSWGSICTLNYAPFFDQAVMVIDSACDDFKPPG